MDSRFNRRAFLGGVAAVSLHESSVAQSRPADKPPTLSAYQFSGNIWVWANDRLLTCYRADPTQKYPYFYPVAGPATGISLTDESAMPYPHHRSLFLACDRVNGANYWQEGGERGRILSAGPSMTASESTVVIDDRCEWRTPEQPSVLRDNRRFTITAPQAHLHLIDADIAWTALTAVHISQTNHSLFAIRAARPLAPVGGGRLINSAGACGEKSTFGQKAKWCGFEGTRCGTTEAIVLMDHPANPWSPCRWFTRDYGFASPTPFNWLDESGWKLREQQTLRLRYRVVLSGRRLDPTELNLLHAEFAKA